jgi:hypothetical protein
MMVAFLLVLAGMVTCQNPEESCTDDISLLQVRHSIVKDRGMVNLQDHASQPGEGAVVHIPKKIFVYWKEDDPNHDKDEDLDSLIAEQSIKNLRKWNPGWEIARLTDDNFTNQLRPVPPGLKHLSHIQHKIDWLRLTVITHQGGVWIDATTIPLGPVSQWVDVSKDAVQGFETPWIERDCQCQIMENWGFAAPPRNALMESWLAEYEMAIQMGPDAYSEYITTDTVTGEAIFSTVRNQLPYLFQHAAFMRARMQRPMDTLLLRSSKNRGPLWYIYMMPSLGMYNSSWGAQFLAKTIHGSCDVAGVPFVKLPGNERLECLSLIQQHAYGSGSLLQVGLGLPILQGSGAAPVSLFTRGCPNTLVMPVDPVPHERYIASLGLWDALLRVDPFLTQRNYSLLDMGASDGALAAHMQNRLKLTQVKGYDVVKPTDNTYALEENEVTPVLLYDGQHIPEGPHQFDLVSFVFVLHHAAENQTQLLQQAASIARNYVLVAEDLALPEYQQRNYEHDPHAIFHSDRDWHAIFEYTGLRVLDSGPMYSDCFENCLQHYYILAPANRTSDTFAPLSGYQSLT